jgi:methionine synthase / methylenetetrahydrofolate reductase(NADPH)
MNKFLEKISKGVLVCDGAMGTMLYSKGIYLNKCFDELNLTNPDLVFDVHKEYVRAGADIIETNTFGANRFRLLPFGLEKKVYEINKAAVGIAKKASEGNCMVAGSVGPVNAHLKPLGGITVEELTDIFSEQISALVEAQIDLLILETFPGIEMLKVAVAAAKSLTKIPVVAQVTLNDWGTTLLEEPPAMVVKKLKDTGADVIGANCSVGPSVMLDSIQAMRLESSVYLSAMPNAGLPRLVDGRFIYLTSPEYMAEFAKRFIQSGVSLIGGCCGTTPEHIKAMIGAVRAVQPRIVPEKFEYEQKIEISAQTDRSKDDAWQSPLAKKILAGSFVKCVEIDPPKGISHNIILGTVERLLEKGVDAVNIADGPRATARMSPIALASLIKNKTKMDVILHFCCRDRNILGMQSDLLGAGALGIENILAVTGDPPKLGDYPSATAVYDVDSIGLLKIASNLNRGLDVAGNPMGSQTSFLLGAAFNPVAMNIAEEMKRLELKLGAGANFIMTQPVFDMELLERALDKIKKFKLPVLAGILPLYSLKNAEFLHNEVPGMSIPDKIMARMKKSPAGNVAREEGISLAREALAGCKNMVQGVYVMPPFGKYEMALEVLGL